MLPIYYCIEEVDRQGHETTRLDGICRVGWMLNAWAYALKNSNEGRVPNFYDAIHIGVLMEPEKNALGIRTCDVYVGDHLCPDPRDLKCLLVELFEAYRSGEYQNEPIRFYKAFEEIHPFIDGNGRTGKVLLNWVHGSLLHPFFPPANLWGRPIRNP